MSERKKHIAVLKEMLEWMNMSSEVIKKDDPFFRVHEHRKKAVKYAISSLETDEAYQLEYESTTKNDLAVSNGLENGSPIIDWNNCHTSEQLNSIATTKNDLGVDCISRNDVRDVMQELWGTSGELMDRLMALPSVTPQEPQSFKWCTTCKEYDQEKHCCHRYSKVIRDTVAEIRQEPRWIPVSERLPEKTGWYLVTFKIYGGECAVCELSYRKPENYWTDKDISRKILSNDEILAWMPLPESYKENKDA